jgi:hypothetical protein
MAIRFDLLVSFGHRSRVNIWFLSLSGDDANGPVRADYHLMIGVLERNKKRRPTGID